MMPTKKKAVLESLSRDRGCCVKEDWDEKSKRDEDPKEETEGDIGKERKQGIELF